MKLAFKKQTAVGEGEAKLATGETGIDRVLASKPAHQGTGRIITTVGSLEDVHKLMDEGYSILWCQMSKLIPGEKKGDTHEG